MRSRRAESEAGAEQIDAASAQSSVGRCLPLGGVERRWQDPLARLLLADALHAIEERLQVLPARLKDVQHLRTTRKQSPNKCAGNPSL